MERTDSPETMIRAAAALPLEPETTGRDRVAPEAPVRAEREVGALGPVARVVARVGPDPAGAGLQA
jgi:hypothetical protein